MCLNAKDWLNRVAEFYYKQENLCSCHLDLNPGNILLHENKAFLIDFTDSHLDDRFIDLGKFSAYMGLGTREKKLS
ncbi:phosphotransferase [Legionella brunensis]|uniref:phosphotransferase n=1 Tax=Legionella brunensis TaxID=29422 RepID=UPI003BF78B15